jgi:hypothetical protein
MNKMLKNLTVPFLFLCTGCQLSATELSLNTVDAVLIAKNFSLNEALGEGEYSNNSTKIPGCKQVRKFDIYEGSHPSPIVMALCDEGDFSPTNIQATIDKQVNQAKQALGRMPSEMSKILLSGLPGVPVALDGNRKGMAITIPVIGHGIGMIPTAYAIDEERKITLYIQAYTDPNNPRNLNVPMAKLLKAIDRHVHESVK